MLRVWLLLAARSSAWRGHEVPPALFLFRDQFAHCPWVHVSQDGEQCENGNLVFCLPYGLLAAVLLLAALMALQIHESKRGPQEENAGEVDLKETPRSNGAMGHTQNVLSEHGDL